MATPTLVNSDFPEVVEGAASPIYQRRLTAYVDVLGWSDLVERSTRDPAILASLSPVKNLLSFPSLAAAQQRSFFAEHLGYAPPAVDATHFSDTIVLSCPLRGGGPSSLLSSLQLMCMMLLQAGFYTRGAVVVGLLHHDDRALFGPALIDAYHLERDVAKYPRIVITPEALSLLSPPKYAIRQDADSLLYVDILGFVAEGPDERRHLKGFEEQMLADARGRLHRDSTDLGRVAKHSWMIRYLEAVIGEGSHPTT